ncbi:YfcL family protein [Algibacillus agarilyticus]|uniref:YfcL family protein n=1 Tax=Algibacillus agarilyticus TaxID=2234133 RepID=UPI000DD03704|nr:YfcL family protein [Algibacillus agarilyticus]
MSTTAEPLYVQKILDGLDAMMQSEDADALFISGYLRGHVTLIIGRLEMDNELDEQTLINSMNKALVTARQSGELSPQDAEFVEQAWATLID